MTPPNAGLIFSAEKGVYNFPMASPITSHQFRSNWDTIVHHVREKPPGIIFVSGGFDGHYKDPCMMLTTGGSMSELDEADFGYVGRLISQLHRDLGAPVISCLEGGYDIIGGPMSNFASSWLAHHLALVSPE